MLPFVLDVIVLWNLLLISIRIVLPLLLFGIDLGLGEWNLVSLMDNYDDRLLHNLKLKRFGIHGLPRYLVFAIFLRFIWKWRCKVVFYHNFLLHVEPRLLIYQCILEWFSACNLMVILLERSVVCLHWMAPLPNVCKINTDGSRINSSCHIEVGGLLRDSCGS
ncbi:unnamed protein product, partial [Prunus brigantina]